MKKRNYVAGLAVAVVLAACGGGSSDSSGETTASTRVKNAALPTTTDVTATSVVAESTTVAPGTNVDATTTTSPGDVTTTSIAPVDSKRVKDPGNFTPTYLAATDALGAPRPALPTEASVETNASKAVSATYATDSSGILTVSASQWVGTSSPMTLRWTVGGIPCDNCAFLSTTAKKVVKSLLSVKFAGSGITSIRGLDSTATALGQYQGNGWGFEVLIGDATSSSAVATGNAIRDWALNCTGTTASTCKNVDLGIGELRWKNQIWSVADCTSALQNGGPKILLVDLSKALKGVDASTASFVRQRAAIDRVVIATPTYRPVFASSGSTRALTGFASTGCAK